MIRAFAVALILSVMLAGSAVAQEQPAGIQATGIGTASAPVQTAHLQVLLGSSAAFGYAPYASVEFASGTPGAEMPMEGAMGMPMPLSIEQLDPVVETIVAAGIDSDAIETTFPASSSMFGPGGPETAELRVTIVQPQPGDLTELVAEVRVVAQRSGLTVLHVGARYDAADCASLIQEARVAAIADANLRAEGLALGLGVTLGELTQAIESPYFGPTGMEACGSTGMSGNFGPYGPGSRARLRSKRHRSDGHRAGHPLLRNRHGGVGIETAAQMGSHQFPSSHLYTRHLEINGLSMRAWRNPRGSRPASISIKRASSFRAGSGGVPFPGSNKRLGGQAGSGNQFNLTSRIDRDVHELSPELRFHQSS